MTHGVKVDDLEKRSQSAALLTVFWACVVAFIWCIFAVVRWGWWGTLKAIGGQTAAAWVQAFGTIAAMGVTAAVLYFQNKKAAELQAKEHSRLASETVDKEVYECNRALLLLQSQIIFLFSYYQQQAARFEGSDLRHIFLPSQEPQSFVRVNAADLAFLTKKFGGSQYLVRVEEADRQVEDTIQMMRKRSSFYDRAIQPKIREARAAGKDFDQITIASFIGNGPDVHEVLHYTDSLYQSLHNTVGSLRSLSEDFPAWLSLQYAPRTIHRIAPAS